MRVSGSGLGCPDWPLCQGGVTPGDTAAAIEFGHRVYAGLTMLAVFAAAALAFPRRAEIRAPAFFLLSAAALILIQALIGGVAVLTELPKFIIMVHLTMGMTILALLTAAGLRILTRGGGAPPFNLPARAAVLTAAGAIMVGGSIVATQTGPGCLNLPFCDSDSTTMATWLHTFHRVLGVVLFATAAAVAFAVRRSGGPPLAAGLSAGLVVLVIGQMTAGAVAVATTFPESLRILHVGFATLIWASLIGLWALAVPFRRT